MRTRPAVGGGRVVLVPRRADLGEAVRRGHGVTDAAEIAKAARLEEEDIEPYTIEEVQSLLDEAAKLRNSARWVVALALGLRQGEALGLHWEDVDSASTRKPRSASGARPVPTGRARGTSSPRPSTDR
ncbi:hypothetical protein [Streptomyces sp. NPDC001068]|uniref:hypothetical protein n=1 Tax=Streptomyces sp. NPDC001068 TaxID=3364544 RepID=UPI0036A2F458